MEPKAFGSEIHQLRVAGWSCRWRELSGSSANVEDLPHDVRQRYPWLPEDYLGFVRGLLLCADANDTRWILTPHDYVAGDERVYSHDEWEKLSLEACGDDEGTVRRVSDFWDGHFPFFMDVSDGYAFHAIRVTDRSGVIVSGKEPEFEEVQVVANSFTDFLGQLVRN